MNTNTEVTIMATKKEPLVYGVMKDATVLGKNMATNLETMIDRQKTVDTAYEERVQMSEERVEIREKLVEEGELCEGVSKSAREYQGQPPKFAREQGALGDELQAPKGNGEMKGVESHVPPMTFTIGVGHVDTKKHKKVVKKSRQVMSVQGGKTESGVGVGKRKSGWLESEMDGEGTMMNEMDVQGKKPKRIDDNFDGNLCSLTVAEVGQHQPREDQ